MDLGLHGEKAIVCAASKGFRKGVSVLPAREGVELTNAPSPDALETTAEDIRRECGVKVTAIASSSSSSSPNVLSSRRIISYGLLDS